MGKVETNQRLIGSAATILLLHNSLFLALGIISIFLSIKFGHYENQMHLPLWIGTHGLDIVGILLLGMGLYGFSKAVPDGDIFAKDSGLLFLFWVLLTLIWRLFWRSVFFYNNLWQYLRWAENLSNFWVVGIFFIASILLAVAVACLNKMIDRYRKRGIILKGGGDLYTMYAILNVCGASMITIAHSKDYDFFRQLGLGFLGLQIKKFVVPILGILLFSQLRGVFGEMELPSESNHH